MDAIGLIVRRDAQDVVVRTHELCAHELGEQTGKHEEQATRNEVLHGDHFVIEAEHELFDKRVRRRMDVA
jgi:hypothetical protein